MSKSGLKQARIPTHETIALSGIIPFWGKIQCAANSHYRNLHVKYWETNYTMSVVIDDDKHELNYKVSTDNLLLILHIRDNRLGIVNHDVALTGAN